MKFARINTPQGAVCGLIGDAGFVSIAELLPEAPRDAIELISQWEVLAPRLLTLATASQAWRPYSRKDLLAPVPRPGKMLAIGLNYADHVSEMGFTAPQYQTWFSKQTSCVNDPYAAVEIPKVSACVDYEVELVVVIGKRGRHIPEQSARHHVMGYCVGNDVSVRDWQMRTPQWDLGKSFDTHGPFGPWITTTQEIEDPHGRAIRCFVNDELRQDANTGQLFFNVWQQIAYLSQVMTLEPGDVIFTGTPAGVGCKFDPPKYLRAGDVVRCEIDGLGSIENRCVDPV